MQLVDDAGEDDQRDQGAREPPYQQSFGSGLFGGVDDRMQPRFAQFAFPQPILNDPEDHADAGRAESEMPADFLSEVTADQRPDQGADIDAHVIVRIPGVSFRSSFRIELADQTADIGFEQSGADDDQRQSQVEGEI